MITALLLQLAFMETGLAAIYNDKIFACPKKSYQRFHLPTAAHRLLNCGTIINVKRVDNGRVEKAIIADRGPFGVCVPSRYSTRGCGQSFKWMNGRNFIKRHLPMKTATWRGILDMSPLLAKRLGVKNRLARVIIYTDATNISALDDEDDPKIYRRALNEINTKTNQIGNNTLE